MLASYLILALSTLTYAQSYNYTKGGRDWPGICKTGRLQSPINLEYKEAVLAPYNLGSLMFNFTETVVTGNFTDVGLSYFGNFGNVACMTQEGYYSGTIDAIFFFAPSQTYLNDKQYPFEVTFISLANGKGGMYSYTTTILFTVGKEDNVFIDQVYNITQGVKKQKLNAAYAFPSDYIRTFYHFYGSIPAPPCTEPVSWHVPTKTMEMSKQQLDYFTSQWAKNPNFAGNHGNNRDLKKRNGRKITLYRGF